MTVALCTGHICPVTCFFSWLDSRRFRDNTQTCHAGSDSSGRVIGPLQRRVPDNTQHSQERDIMPSVGFEPEIPGPRPKPRGHWDQRNNVIYYSLKSVLFLEYLSCVLRVFTTNIPYSSTCEFLVYLVNNTYSIEI